MGSLCNAFSSVLLTILVIRILGKGSESDIFSLAYSTASLFSTIGLFEVRQFQSTDINSEFKFSDYLTMRYINCTLMMIVTTFFILIKNYDIHKGLIIFLVCLYMMIGALQDVYHGLFQLKNRLDLAGKSLSSRVTVSSITFILTLLLTKNLILSCIILCLSSIACFCLYDLSLSKSLGLKNLIKSKFLYKKQKKLYLSCLPLFVCAFLSIYILNAPKYAIDRFFSSSNGIQTSYGILVMPAAVINLLSLFAFRPVMTPMAESYSNGDIKAFLKTFKKLLLWISLTTIVCITLGYTIGVNILSKLCAYDLNSYRIPFAIILLGGGFSALLGIIQYIITILRKQNSLILGYILAGIISYSMSSILIPKYPILGGALSYTSVYLFLTIYFIALIIYYKKDFKKANCV